ncbi:MAG: autotransporter assembly complex protein TamA [Proteobacteria bacterium]|nr:autotransporter assembly complex protein TamA [Pseudomonadota bacterium]
MLLCSCSLLPNSAAKKKAAEAAAETPRIAVEIVGVDGALARNVHDHLSVTHKPCSVSKAYLAVLGKRGEEEAREALRAFGYYDPTVTASVVADSNCPVASLVIDAGQRVKLHTVEAELTGPGEADEGFSEKLKDIDLTSGSGLNHGDYSKAKQLFESVALERGYLEGKFVKHELRVNPDALRADIALVFDTGPRYQLGEVRIKQEPEFLDESLITRFLEGNEDAAYDASLVSNHHLALSKSSYFERVDVRPRLSSPENDTIPIDISLTPRDRHALDTGIGASTDEGIRGRFGYQNRRLNRFGHQFETMINGSFIEQKLSAAYRFPRAHPIDEWLSVHAGVRRREVDTFTTIETQISVTETKRRAGGWKETRFIELNRQDYAVSATEDTSNFLSPGINWRRTVTDNDLFPTRGYDINVELKAASEAIIADTSFLSSLISLAWIRGLPWNSRVLLRGHFGAIWVDEFRELPPSERFFAGGDNSIRGFDIDTVGPVDAANKVVGGTELGVVSVELEHYFTDTWGVAMFADTGNAFGGDGGATGLQTGIGLGVRWRSPVGPVRLDIAHPLDDPDNSFRIHMRIGPDF